VTVIAGLVPAISLNEALCQSHRDARDKRGHGAEESAAFRHTLRSRDAVGARVIGQAALNLCLERTGGFVFASLNKGKRSAERRIQFRLLRPSLYPPPRAGEGKGGGTAAVICDRSPFGAPLRSCAGCYPTRPGPRFLESPDANGRTLSGTSAASTSQPGHAPDGTMPKPPADEERRTPPAGTAPAPSVGVTG
jgi:hypothetical protein